MIHLGDGFKALAALPSDCAELVFCDPDWEIGIKMDHQGSYRVGETAQNCARSVLWWETSAFILTLRDGLRVAQNVMFKFSGKSLHIGEIYRRVFGAAAPAGVFIWDKGPGAPGFFNGGITNNTETLWWFTRDGKGARRRTHAERKTVQDVIRDHRYHENAKISPHGCEMSRRLCEWLVRGFTAPGDTILDLCAGSGVLVAHALRLGRNAVGYEINAAIHAASRIVIGGAKSRIPGQAGLWS